MAPPKNPRKARYRWVVSDEHKRGGDRMADKETVRAYMLALEKGPQESTSGAAVQRLDGYYYLPGADLGETIAKLKEAGFEHGTTWEAVGGVPSFEG